MAKKKKQVKPAAKKQRKEVSTVAKAKRRRRSSNGQTIPVALLAGFMPVGLEAIHGMQVGGWKGMLHQVTYSFTGWDTDARNWESSRLSGGLYPVLIGMAVHKVAEKFGVNRALGRARIPFLRV